MAIWYFKLTRDEVIEQAERIVFEHGGWLACATKLGMSREALVRHIKRNNNVVDMRAWLSALRNTLAA